MRYETTLKSAIGFFMLSMLSGAVEPTQVVEKARKPYIPSPFERAFATTNDEKMVDALISNMAADYREYPNSPVFVGTRTYGNIKIIRNKDDQYLQKYQNKFPKLKLNRKKFTYFALKNDRYKYDYYAFLFGKKKISFFVPTICHKKFLSERRFANKMLHMPSLTSLESKNTHGAEYAEMTTYPYVEIDCTDDFKLVVFDQRFRKPEESTSKEELNSKKRYFTGVFLIPEK